MFLDLVSSKLPWNKICKDYKDRLIPFNEASKQVAILKKEFLEHDSFLIDYIKLATKLPFKRSEQKIQKLRDVLVKFIKKSE